MKIKLLTYNIFSGRTLDKKYDLGGKIDIIRQTSPDIIGLNEVHNNTNHSGFTSQTDIIAGELGFPHKFFARTIDHDGGEYGIALISRFPILKCENIPIPDICGDKRDSRFEDRTHICADIDCAGTVLHVITSHYGLSVPERESAVSQTLKISGSFNFERVVFMGDLNTKPDEELLKPLFSVFCDAGENLEGEQGYTFRSDNPTERIDYILFSRDIKLCSAFVPRFISSDHLPVFAEIEI